MGDYWSFREDLFRARIKWLRSLPIGLFALLLGTFLLSGTGLIAFSYLAGSASHIWTLPPNYPNEIRTDTTEIPETVQIKGVGTVNGDAVAYTEQGFFAVFRNGSLQQMLARPSERSGICEDCIFAVYGKSLYRYDTDGRLLTEESADALAEEAIVSSEQASVGSCLYRVTHKRGVDLVTVEIDGETTILLSHRYVNPAVYLVLAIISGVMLAACIIFILARALPYRLAVLRKYELID